MSTLKVEKYLNELNRFKQEGPWNHPRMGTCAYRLAQTYEESGQQKLAQELYEDALDFQSRILPNDHCDLDATRSSLGQLLRKQENIKEPLLIEAQRVTPLGQYPDDDTLYQTYSKEEYDNNEIFLYEEIVDPYDTMPSVGKHRLEPFTTFYSNVKDPLDLLKAITINLNSFKSPEVSKIVVEQRNGWFKVRAATSDCSLVATLYQPDEEAPKNATCIVEFMRTRDDTFVFNEIYTYVYKKLKEHNLIVE